MIPRSTSAGDGGWVRSQVSAGPAPEKVGGWGLHLVKQLADAWGVIRNGPNFVWFELML